VGTYICPHAWVRPVCPFVSSYPGRWRSALPSSSFCFALFLQCTPPPFLCRRSHVGSPGRGTEVVPNLFFGVWLRANSVPQAFSTVKVATPLISIVPYETLWCCSGCPGFFSNCGVVSRRMGLATSDRRLPSRPDNLALSSQWAGPSSRPQMIPPSHSGLPRKRKQARNVPPSLIWDSLPPSFSTHVLRSVVFQRPHLLSFFPNRFFTPIRSSLASTTSQGDFFLAHHRSFFPPLDAAGETAAQLDIYPFISACSLSLAILRRWTFQVV